MAGRLEHGSCTVQIVRWGVSFQDFVGWAASLVLVLTIVTQVYRQWEQGSSKGVSKWLFIGQMAASGGFLLYSWLIHDPVFLFTNALMIVSAAAGLGIVLWHRTQHPDEKDVQQGAMAFEKEGSSKERVGRPDQT